MLGLILSGTVAAILFLNVLLAFIRGYDKALMRFISVLITGVVAVVSCLIFKSYLPDGAGVIEIINENIDMLRQMLGAYAVDMAVGIMGYFPTLLETVVQLAGALIAPILCLLLFILFGVIYWIAYLLATLVRRIVLRIPPVKKRKRYRGRAALVGLLQGVVISAFLLLPISGYLGMVEPVMDLAIEHKLVNAEDPTFQSAQIVVNDLRDSFAMKAYRTVGGKLLTNTVMSMKVAGARTNVQKEVDTAVTLADSALHLAYSNVLKVGEEEAELIRTMGNAFAESKILAPVVGEALYAVTDTWMNDEAFLGIRMPALKAYIGSYSEIVDPTVDVLMTIIHEDAASPDALRNDVQTIAEMGAIVVESGILSHITNTDNLVNALSDEVMVTDLVETLGSNHSLNRIIPEMTNLGIRAMGYFLSIPSDTQDIYDTCLGRITDALNKGDFSDPDQVEDLAEVIGSALDQAGIFVDTELLDLYAAAMISDLVEHNLRGTVIPEDVGAFFVLYSREARALIGNQVESVSATGIPSVQVLASAQTDPLKGTIYEGLTFNQQKSTAASCLPALFSQIMNMDANLIDYPERVVALSTATYSALLGENHAVVEALKRLEVTRKPTSKEVLSAVGLESLTELKKRTCVVTTEMMLVDAEAVAEALGPDAISEEVVMIFALIEAAQKTMDLMKGGFSELNMQNLSGTVGGVLDSLSASGIFGKERSSYLFVAVMQSKQIRDAVGLDLRTATELAGYVNANDGSYSQTMGVVGGSLGLFQDLQNSETISNEALVELMKDMTPQSADLFKVFVSADRLAGYGIPASKAEGASAMMGELFNYMARDDIEDYDTEAQALTHLLQMTLGARDSENKSFFSSEDGAVEGKLPSAKKTITTLLNSGAVRSAILRTMTDGEQVTGEDPIGLSDRIKPDTQDYDDAVAAICAYRAENNDEDGLLYDAVFAMFGLTDPEK